MDRTTNEHERMNCKFRNKTWHRSLDPDNCNVMWDDLYGYFQSVTCDIYKKLYREWTKIMANFMVQVSEITNDYTEKGKKHLNACFNTKTRIETLKLLVTLYNTGTNKRQFMLN